MKQTFLTLAILALALPVGSSCPAMGPNRAYNLPPAQRIMEPGPGVGETLVVQIDRVLRGQHHPQAVRPRLLEQGEHGGLGRRVGGGREEAEDLVHIQQRPQRAGAGLRAHPRDHLVE